MKKTERDRFETACKVLGILPGDTSEDVRRKYRRLVLRLHPDAQIGQDSFCPEEDHIFVSMGGGGQADQAGIADVNEAYMILIKQRLFEKYKETIPKQENKSGRAAWNAPVNPHAFMERKIYQNAEDHEGNVIGTFAVAEGRYYWDHESEDFKLFLKSMLGCVNYLVEEKEEQSGSSLSEWGKLMLQKELLYLLAGQFTDTEKGLDVFAADIVRDEQGRQVYFIPGMLEVQSKIRKIAEGEILFPLRVRDHRLYLGREKGAPLGYLSFQDDRLYYVLIPMFENREVQVRIRTAEGVIHRNRQGSFLRLNLWVRRNEHGDSTAVAESVNAKIQKLLDSAIS